MENEVWRFIDSFEDCYMISNFGRVKSMQRHIKNYLSKEFIMKNIKHDKGYEQVNLRTKGKYKKIFIHRAIACAFIPNPKNKQQINHKNGIKNDNRIENLEWSTRSENIIHAYQTGLMKKEKNYKRLSESKCAVPIKMLTIDGVIVECFGSIANAVLKTGFNKSGICECAKGKRKHHKGYLWEYALPNENFELELQ